MRKYEYWLCCIPGIGNRTIGALLEEYGDAGRIYAAPAKQLRQILKKGQLAALEEVREQWDLQREYAELEEKGICFLTREDECYPTRLREIPDAPYGIFYRGSLPGEECFSVAIIGARDCSEYGRYVAGELGSFLGGNGVQVISGMARGIDGIGQKAALQAGGCTTAVLGCGVDVCYPRENRELYEEILRRGCILSSYPPGTLPKAQNFPPRNRIVSGLADVVVVIEARSRSGTLITVDMALEQGKEVYVVPGRITDRLSDGCNRLIKQGAGILLSPAELLVEIRELEERRGRCLHMQEKSGKGSAEEKREREVPKELRHIYALLDFEPKSAEQLWEGLLEKGDISSLNIALMKLCVMGAAEQKTPGYFVRKLV